MITNNAVWIHGLIKHCLRSWTAARTNFAISTLVFAKWQSRPPRENMSTTSRCDLFRDACKTTRSGAMNTDRIMIPWSKLRKYCHGQLRQLSRMSICGFHARSRKPRRSWLHGVKFSKWRTSGNYADASAFHQPKLKYFQLLNCKDSMQNIDTIIH